jgi:rRNA maturation endonuclease Nob1
LGNDIIWWQLGGGYTTNLSKAEVFTKEKAQQQHDSRLTDIPWPKEYIDARTRPAVDMQNCDRQNALKGTGIVLTKYKPPKKAKIHCNGCGIFITERQMYQELCPRCGADNCP